MQIKAVGSDLIIHQNVEYEKGAKPSPSSAAGKCLLAWEDQPCRENVTTENPLITARRQYKSGADRTQKTAAFVIRLSTPGKRKEGNAFLAHTSPASDLLSQTSSSLKGIPARARSIDVFSRRSKHQAASLLEHTKILDDCRIIGEAGIGRFLDN